MRWQDVRSGMAGGGDKESDSEREVQLDVREGALAAIAMLLLGMVLGIEYVSPDEAMALCLLKTV